MPRKPRIEFPGAFYHVISRGNNAQTIYKDQNDFREFLRCSELTKQRFPFNLYAYTLMTNHFHLLMQTPQTPLSTIMGSILTRYSKYFNHRHNRTGHLFSARYKAILCQKDTYLLSLIRYIHLNPVRAKMVSDPSDWPWSSHRIYLGKTRSPLVNITEILARFSKNSRRAHECYRNFVLEPILHQSDEMLVPLDTSPLINIPDCVSQALEERVLLKRV